MSTASSSLRAVFRVRLAREYHVGAGHGRGTDVDAVLFTDFGGDDAAPAVRYAHGFLRQAAYDLVTLPPLAAWQLCGRSRPEAEYRREDYCEHAPVIDPADEEEPSPCPLCRIFGSPAHPSPWSFSTMRPVSPSEAPGHPPLQRSRVASRTSVDPATRRAADGKLFSEELGAPLEFELVAERTGTEEGALDELAFLVAAARCIPGIGAGRRRGRGECAVVIHACEGMQLDADSLLARFDQAWLQGKRGKWRRRTGRPHAFGGAEGTAAPVSWAARGPAGEWEELRLVARAEEPLVVGVQPLTGNVLESEPFVPGTLLLGALAGKALGGGAAEDDFLRAFRGGAVHFPDLLPAYESVDGYLPTLPAPLDLRTCPLHPGPRAAGGHGVWSLPLFPGSIPPRVCPVCKQVDGGEDGPEVKLARVGPFLVDGTDWREWKSRRGEETKIEVHPRTGRVQEESLYHRETIPAGTLLAGTLRGEPGALDWLRMQGVFAGERGEVALRLGKRNGRGYGRLRLAWETVPADEHARERERTRERIDGLLRNGDPVPVVLASRLLLRDGFGRTRQSLAPADFGLAGEGSCTVAWAPVGGFWRHVGLPRRRDAALLPGSVLHLCPPMDDLDDWTERILALADEPPRGERAAEGFGRVAVAPFPYGWIGEEAGGAAGPAPFPIPEALRRERILPARGLLPSADPAARWVAEYSGRIVRAGLPLDGFPDEWQAVARVLYGRAGEPAGRLLDALEKGGGDPHGELDRLGKSRERKSFLLGDGKGAKPWSVLRRMVEDAAGAEPEAERALRTRSLADAIADRAAPGKDAR